MQSTNLQAGYQYLVDNNLIDNFRNYQFTELDLNERKICCLDEFQVLCNIDIKLDLENIAKNRSYAGLAEYIYELIIYTRQTSGSQMNPSCTIF